MTLTEFLEARFAEDDVRATMREWHTVDCAWLPDQAGYTYPCDCEVEKRLRAEVEAKRRIVEAWQENDELHNSPGFHYRAQTFERIVRTLAAVYADHPDYPPEWIL